MFVTKREETEEFLTGKQLKIPMMVQQEKKEGLWGKTVITEMPLLPLNRRD